MANCSTISWTRYPGTTSGKCWSGSGGHLILLAPCSSSPGFVRSTGSQGLMSDILKVNSSGPDVAAPQQALATAGFNPGQVDGTFGLGTEVAVLAFQRSKGLAADGVVGPSTATALGLAAVPTAPSAVPGVTVQVVSQ